MNSRIQITKSLTTLHESDFALYLKDTADKLYSGNLQKLDIANLLEDIEGLSSSQKRKVESLLNIIISPTLKRCYVGLPNCYRGWELVIRLVRYANTPY